LPASIPAELGRNSDIWGMMRGNAICLHLRISAMKVILKIKLECETDGDVTITELRRREMEILNALNIQSIVDLDQNDDDGWMLFIASLSIKVK
jgi:hypothetical protein